LADRFAAALQSVDGRVIIVRGPEEARQAILESLQAWEARNVFVAHSIVLEQLELAEMLRAAQLTVAEQAEDGALVGKNGGGGSVREFLAEADVGITGVDLAIAETGTLVLAAAPGHPRMASALPPRHLAVVRAEQIVPALADVIPRLKERFLEADGSLSTSCVSLITGPSRTADIEQTLTVGVHGPRELLAVVIT
jgi:L-lactate dehydrogenase complex protein LldG